MIAWMCVFSDCNGSESQWSTSKYMQNIIQYTWRKVRSNITPEFQIAWIVMGVRRLRAWAYEIPRALPRKMSQIYTVNLGGDRLFFFSKLNHDIKNFKKKLKYDCIVTWSYFMYLYMQYLPENYLWNFFIDVS
jgi:hypothetical protein